jgi:large subunit ribosomal protein L10|tara:strand:+ start:1149 stop:2690 length:1542 start_codon:yes stop_codon:yes gene_type:complete
MPKIAEYKKKLVEDMVKLMRQSSMIGIVDMNNLPAPQLQSMRSELRGKINLFMTKKRLMKIALEKIKNEKKHIEELEKYLGGMPALLFANESPFKLSRTLQKSKTSAPAKANQIAPNDITINKGPTPFAPGPIISELSSVGLKVGVEAGKVAVKEDSVVAKRGEKIKPKVAEILTRLDIKPMEVGLGLVAAYENGIIYQKDILEIDEKAFNEKINLASTQALNLSFNIAYITKDNINLLLAKAFNDAKAIGISQKILDKGIIEQLLSKAEMEMLELKGSANIETKPKEIKEESKPKEEPKAEEKKIEVPEQEKIQKKEEKVLEEEKKIIEEEKKLEKEKQKETPVEKEVQEAVKKEEEKTLEKERIEKEKELEKVEEQKEEIKKAEEKKEEPRQEQKIEQQKPEETRKEKPKEDVDKKIKAMVEQTKKFAEGKKETAADIIEEVKEEEKEEEKIEEQKTKKETKKKDKEVPTAHDFKAQKEDKEKTENKEDKGRKEVEDLTKELLKKGTLRKK